MFQLVVAQVIGALFAMLMTAVIVGTSLQIQKDGILSPNSIFSFAVLARYTYLQKQPKFCSFLTAAILHPLEFTCVIPGILYFLAIPCMYMLLPIYSVCNMNTVAWGTREDPLKTEKNDLAKKRGKSGTHLDLIDNSAADGADGSFSFGCGSACRLLCCLKPDPMESSPAVYRMNEKLSEITRKLDRLERKTQPGLTRRASIISTNVNADKCSEIMDEDDQAELEDDLDMTTQSHAAKKNQKWKHAQSEAWLAEKCLKRAEKETMDNDEEKFWLDVIDKYLSPFSLDSKEQQRLAAGLYDLRNKVC